MSDRSALLARGQTPAQQQQPQLPRPTFETKTELVLIDVNVIDRDARPVPTLTADDFELQVNGQPRKIDSLQFVSTVPANATPTTARESAFSSNEMATTGRLLLFVVDENNLRTGSSRTILRTAQTLFDRLGPGDMIGLARLPNGTGNVEFTTNRARVTAAMGRITGMVGGRTGMTKVNLSEAWAHESNDLSLWENAIERECAGHDRRRPRSVHQRARKRRARHDHRNRAPAPASRCRRSKGCSRAWARSSSRSTS